LYQGKSILGIIPARGGSKGLPGKNIKPLLGKPLIAWTIEHAKASQYIDHVVVSTDDEEIAKISQEYHAEVPFLRPAELANDSAPMLDVIVHALNYFQENNRLFDIIVLLEPTSPLRKKGDVDKAIRLLIDHENTADSLVSVGEIHLESPYISKVITDGTDGYVKPFVKEEAHITRRQQLSSVYFPYGVVYASKTAALRQQGTFYQDRTIPYIIERWQNYEIDDIYDFLCIEAIFKDKLEEIQ
jgi:CMP-N-acetylneuraminic acid synthetase